MKYITKTLLLLVLSLCSIVQAAQQWGNAGYASATGAAGYKLPAVKPGTQIIFYTANTDENVDPYLSVKVNNGAWVSDDDGAMSVLGWDDDTTNSRNSAIVITAVAGAEYYFKDERASGVDVYMYYEVKDPPTVTLTPTAATTGKNTAVSFTLTVSDQNYDLSQVYLQMKAPNGLYSVLSTTGATTYNGTQITAGTKTFWPTTVASYNTTFTVAFTDPAPTGVYDLYAVAKNFVGGQETISPIAHLTLQNLLNQTITFTDPGAGWVGDVKTLSATASSGLAVTYSVVSGPATLSGSSLTLTGAGTVVVRASQAGNGTYAAATADQNITVYSAPVITSPATAAAVVGKPFTYTITATGSGPSAWTFYKVTAPPVLPALSWMNLDAATGVITGTPTVTGTYSITLRANNGVSSSKTLTLTITNPSLVVTKTGSGSGTVTGSGTYAPGTAVAITATPDASSIFTGWTGSVANSSLASTTSTLTADGQTVTATFVAKGSISSSGTITFPAAMPAVSTTTRTADVKNSGTISLTLTSAATTGDFIPVPGSLPVTIAAGATVSIPVTFNPVALGARTGVMAFTSTDADRPVIIYDLAGTGAASNASPTVTLARVVADGAVQPGNYVYAGDKVAVQATVADTDGNLASIDWSINGGPVTTVAINGYSASPSVTATLALGSNTITATVKDSSGAITTQTYAVVVTDGTTTVTVESQAKPKAGMTNWLDASPVTTRTYTINKVRGPM